MPTLAAAMTTVTDRVKTHLVAGTPAVLVEWPNSPDHSLRSGTAAYVAFKANPQNLGQSDLGNPGSSRVSGFLSFHLYYRSDQGTGDRDTILWILRQTFASQSIAGVHCAGAQVRDGPRRGDWEWTAVHIPFYFDDR